jgi:DNA-binding SARP family transcriptional activator
VAALADKSLVEMEPGIADARYRLLDTVRQYADERLVEAGELDELREAHARFFVAFAELAEPHLAGGAGDLGWLARVTVEGDNLRAAATWAEEDAARNDLLLRLGVAVNWFWFATGQFREARHRLAIAISRAEGSGSLLLGRAYTALAFLAVWQGDHPAVRPAAEESLRLLEGRADDPTLVAALIVAGSAHVLAGDADRALHYADRAVALASRTPSNVLLSLAHYWRGWAVQARGDLAGARGAFEAALACGRRLDHRPAMGHSLVMLGRLAHAEGDDEDAFARFAEALELHAETDDAWGIAMGLEGLAAVSAARGQHRRAVRLLAAAGSLRELIASALTPGERDEHTRLVDGLRQELGDDFARLWGEGRTLTRAEAVRIAVGVVQYTGEFRALALPPAPAPPVHAPASAEGLRVLALGPLQAYIGAEAIDAAAWGSTRTRELLVFLLMHPDGVTKEQVGLAFWPEASAAQLRNSFHVSLHRLRRALRDPEWVTLAGQRYRVDPAVLREFDVAAFEREVAEARQALARGEAGAAAALERALERYRGDFLDGEPAGDWHLEHRHRLQRLYVDALMTLGAHHTAEERHARAADAYRRVLARDELHEDALRALMLAHARLGERSAALRLYRRFADRLREELDAEPDRETAALYERLQ